jgi:hypothetical protein
MARVRPARTGKYYSPRQYHRRSRIRHGPREHWHQIWDDRLIPIDTARVRHAYEVDTNVVDRVWSGAEDAHTMLGNPRLAAVRVTILR